MDLANLSTYCAEKCPNEIATYYFSGDKIFKYCTCPAGQLTYNFYSSCKHMHLSFKKVCGKEHKEVI